MGEQGVNKPQKEGEFLCKAQVKKPKSVHGGRNGKGKVTNYGLYSGDSPRKTLREEKI